MGGLRNILKWKDEQITIGPKGGKKKTVTWKERYRPERIYVTATDSKTDPKTQRLKVLRKAN